MMSTFTDTLSGKTNDGAASDDGAESDDDEKKARWAAAERKRKSRSNLSEDAKRA
jgi:hypothetical protein